MITHVRTTAGEELITHVRTTAFEELITHVRRTVGEELILLLLLSLVLLLGDEVCLLVSEHRSRLAVRRVEVALQLLGVEAFVQVAREGRRALQGRVVGGLVFVIGHAPLSTQQQEQVTLSY